MTVATLEATTVAIPSERWNVLESLIPENDKETKNHFTKLLIAFASNPRKATRESAYSGPKPISPRAAKEAEATSARIAEDLLLEAAEAALDSKDELSPIVNELIEGLYRKPSTLGILTYLASYFSNDSIFNKFVFDRLNEDRDQPMTIEGTSYTAVVLNELDRIKREGQ